MIQKISLYIQEARREFKRVNWPTPKQTLRLTLVVVVMSLLVAAFLGVFDLIFLYSLEFII